MEYDETDSPIASLDASLGRLKALSAWVALKESERKLGAPPLSTVSSTDMEGIRNEKAQFAALAWEVILALNRYEAAEGENSRAKAQRDRIAKLLEEERQLNWPKGL